MTLVKRSDWPSLVRDSWLSDFFDGNRFLDSDIMQRSVPAVNVVEKDNLFEIELAAPGLNKKDFNVTVDKGVLTISAQKEDSKEDKGKNFTRREFSFTSFSRSFALPENVNEEDIKAHYEDGILQLQILKKTPTRQVKKAIQIS
ncbi:MAG TPA: Hsp20/alpha crystallin family protein [Cyclobacteriaceae bacterium]|nr:Hsp20/alpha crystallin family protein [Cyclobacteriaceae bacterium]